MGEDQACKSANCEHRVLLLGGHYGMECHVLQLRRGAGVQKFATPRSLSNVATRPHEILSSSSHCLRWRKEPESFRKPRLTPVLCPGSSAIRSQMSSGPEPRNRGDPWLDCFWRVRLPPSPTHNS
jgi:hypothetical protein